MLEVGPGRSYETPNLAARAATSGDTIRIYPGEYYDCSVWPQDNLVIEGAGPGVVITDLTCHGKGLLIVTGSDVTIRNITFSRARVIDSNGAGIRAEGGNLTIKKSRFVNNESGLLFTGSPQAQITVIDSEFIENGKCEDRCADALRVGQVAVLHVEGSRFEGTKSAASIRSDALRNELIHNEFRDGANGSSSNLIALNNVGTLLMTDNTLQKGPKTSNINGAVFISGSAGKDFRVTGNRFENDTGKETAFIVNWAGSDITTGQNVIAANAKEISTEGGLRNRISVKINELKRMVIAKLRPLVVELVHKLKE